MEEVLRSEYTERTKTKSNAVFQKNVYYWIIIVDTFMHYFTLKVGNVGLIITTLYTLSSVLLVNFSQGSMSFYLNL